MKKIFIGLLFLFFRITINSVDILPNFVGYVLIYLGLAEVIQTPSVETSRMLSAAAAGEPDQPFSALYSRGGRAFCYGWWRMLVVFLILIGVSLVFGIPLILLALMFAFGVPPIVPLILIIIWICVSIVVSVYIYTYMMACSARFFRDALGMPSDPDEQPGTEPEITQ